MPDNWTGTTAERLARLDQAGRRCDGNSRNCTHSAVEKYVLSPAVEFVPTGAESVTRQSCSRHRQQFVNNAAYVVVSTRRFPGRPAGASHPHTIYRQAS